LPRNAQRIDRREKRQKVSLNVRQRLPASRRNRSTTEKRAQRYERDFIFDFGKFGLTTELMCREIVTGKPKETKNV